MIFYARRPGHHAKMEAELIEPARRIETARGISLPRFQFHLRADDVRACLTYNCFVRISLRDAMHADICIF